MLNISRQSLNVCSKRCSCSRRVILGNVSQSSHRFSALWPRGVLGYAVALAAVGAVSVSIGLVLGQVNLANTSMLYLLAVVLILYRPW